MRGKRSKQTRKLMNKYCLTFGFREPYHVLVDSDIVRECAQLKLDLLNGLQRTLHSKEIKPTITQCSMRHLYAHVSEPGMNEVIDLAKTFERRFCGHHPDNFPEPLSTADCLHSVVDGKDTGRNKHLLVVASQDIDLRRMMRTVAGVPLVYVKRGVMILEPMADESTLQRAKEERKKFRAEILQAGQKRKRGTDDDGDEEDGPETKAKNEGQSEESAKKKKKKKNYGPKGANPLSVKKKSTATTPKTNKKEGQDGAAQSANTDKLETTNGTGEAPKKRRRRRKSEKNTEGGEGEAPAAGGVEASEGA